MRGRVHHDTLVDSTNEWAQRELAAGRAQHGDTFVAEGQTAGRGRLGRTWHSAPSEGLYVTVVVRPQSLPGPGALTLAGGLAALDTCRGLGCAAAALDWPNDVIVDGAKLAGVLTETRGLDLGAPAFVVGVGVNFGQSEFPAELTLTRAVTSLALLGHAAKGPAARRAAEERLIEALWRRLPEALERPAQLFQEAFAALVQAQHEVRVDAAGALHVGRFTALDPERGLCLERAKGRAWVPLAHVRSVTLAAVPVQGVETRGTEPDPKSR